MSDKRLWVIEIRDSETAEVRIFKDWTATLPAFLTRDDASRDCREDNHHWRAVDWQTRVRKYVREGS